MASTQKSLVALRRHFSQAIRDHAMIEEGDHIMVGLSGGKDSWALLGLLCDLQPRAPIRYTLSAVIIDGGLIGLDASALEEGCKRLGVPFHLVRQNIFATVAEKKDPGSTFCSMCATLRRGALYRVAREIGATKIALGHHLDDAIETLLLNLFYGGRTAALPPVLISDAGNVPILRPLLYCEESLLRTYAAEEGFAVVGCACPVCPTHPEYEHSDLKRHQIKDFLRRFTSEIPSWRDNVRAALRRVEPSRFFDIRFTEKSAAPTTNISVHPKNQLKTLG